MRTLFVLSALMLSTAARADDNWSIGLGRAFPLKDGGFSGRAGPGLDLNAEYYHQFSWVVGLGLEADFLSFKKKSNDTGLAKVDTTFNASTLAAVVRIAPFYEEQVSPYVLAGFGVNALNGKADATPDPGYVWADTQTNEKRRLTSASSIGAAYLVGGGVDYAINQTAIAGLMTRWHFLEVAPDKFGAQVFKTATIALRFGIRIPN